MSWPTWDAVVPALAVILGVMVQARLTWTANERSQRIERESKRIDFRRSLLNELSFEITRYVDTAYLMMSEISNRGDVDPAEPVEYLSVGYVAQFSEARSKCEMAVLRIGDKDLQGAFAEMIYFLDIETFRANRLDRHEHMHEFRGKYIDVVKQLVGLEEQCWESLNPPPSIRTRLRKIIC